MESPHNQGNTKQEHTGGATRTDLSPTGHAASQAEALQVLIAMSVGPRRDDLGGTGARDGRAVALLEAPAPDTEAAGAPDPETAGAPNLETAGAPDPKTAAAPDPKAAGAPDPEAAGFPPPGPGAPPERRAGRARPGGRHAAAPPPYLERRGARFVVFSAIGGSVFLLGLGLQALLTGRLHMEPVASYLIQAVVSVETSFLLNRWLTWRDRGTPFWTAFARFNAQKTVTIVLNLTLYAGLIRLGLNYLVANVALTAVFTVVNYVAGDRLVFLPSRRPPAEPAAPVRPAQVRRHPAQRVSAVIPCRDNERTIRAAVQSLLDQDYPGLQEIMLIGSPEDPTWKGLADVAHPRLTMWELKTPPGVRDANFKRDAAIRMTSGDLIALVDSDIVLPGDWMSRAVAELENSRAACVAGGMKSFHNSFWGRYTDSTWIGAKTPRVPRSYTVTSANFGTHGRKPPILANTLFTRQLYERCPIDPLWSHGSYEDYEWFWRVTKAGYPIRVCRELIGWHHHRRGLRALAGEYRRSARGCAYFIRAHPGSPLAKRRRRQAIVLPLAGIAGLAAAAAAVADGYGRALVWLLLGGAAVLAIHQVVRSRNLESVLYPAVGITLGLAFTTGLVTNLIRSGSRTAPSLASTTVPEASQRTGRPPRRMLPIVVICALQAALSLTLVRSNTAFTDEAEYLWSGHLELSHWLHAAPLPSALTNILSGSPYIYPAIGAMADVAGGLVAARILSLIFMLGATVLLYLVTKRLFDTAVAIFASALWAVSEPTVRLGAFATHDALSVFLIVFSAWLAVQAAYRRHRAIFALAAAIILALANATAYYSIFIVPIVIAFAFLVWLSAVGAKRASLYAAWLCSAYLTLFIVAMTVSHSWAGILTITGSIAHQAVTFILKNIWLYSSLYILLGAIGAITAILVARRGHRILLVLLSCAVLVAPAVQILQGTEVSLDEHLAYGIWFAAMAAGYACSRLLRSLPTSRRIPTILFCGLALVYPALGNWQTAWHKELSWSNSDSFVVAFKPVAARTHGLIYASTQSYIAKYYIPQGRDWNRWTSGIPFSPPSLSPGSANAFYSKLLRETDYGAIALFYTTTLNELPGNMVLSPADSIAREQLLTVVASDTGSAFVPMRGLPGLTRALENDPSYRLVAVGPYSSKTTQGIYAIWQKKQSA